MVGPSPNYRLQLTRKSGPALVFFVGFTASLLRSAEPGRWPSRYWRTIKWRARRSVGQHTVSSMPPSLTAPRARLAWRFGDFVTNSRE
jgi:hypothetical protein